MKIQIFYISLLFIAADMIFAAEESKVIPKGFKQLADVTDYDLKEIVANFSDADLARFARVSKRFSTIAREDFKTRPSWLWKNGKIIEHSFLAHEGSVARVFFASDGNIVSVGQNDRRIYVWHWDGKAYIKSKPIIDDHDNHFLLLSARFSPASNRLVLYNGNHMITVWDIQTGKKINQFEDINRSQSRELSPDGTTLALTGEQANGNIYLWNVMTGKPRTIKTNFDGDIFATAFSPDGKQLAFVEGIRGPIGVWNFVTNKQEPKLTATDGTVQQFLSYLANGKLIAHSIMSNPRNIIIWDGESGKRISTLDYSGYQPLWSSRLSHNGAIYAADSQAESPKIILWHTQSRQIIKTFNNPQLVIGFVFSPDDKMIIAGCDDGTIHTWKATSPTS